MLGLTFVHFRKISKNAAFKIWKDLNKSITDCCVTCMAILALSSLWLRYYGNVHMWDHYRDIVSDVWAGGAVWWRCVNVYWNV